MIEKWMMWESDERNRTFMRRRFAWMIGVVFILVSMRGAEAQRDKPMDLRGFTFLQITDAGLAGQGDGAALKRFTQQALDMSPRPSFVVANGNLTLAGRPEEYAHFKEAMAPLESGGIKVYAVPGSRDVRWNPDGKALFQQQIGKPYQSFDYTGVHVVLLDTTILVESLGHLDKPELEWLARDLKKVRPETPVFFFLFHGIGRDVPSVRSIDNEYDLVPLIKGRNVIAIFTGHGTQDLAWKTNGIETLSSRGVALSSFYRVRIDGALVTIDRPDSDAEAGSIKNRKPVAILPIAPRAHPSQMKVGWDDPDVAFLARRRPSATLDPRSIVDAPDKESAQYRIDDGPYRPMKKNARDIWQDQFNTRPISTGIHSANIRLTTSNNINYSDELIFEVERDSREPTRHWAVDLGGAIQSSPLLDRDTLYVSSLDGHLYALETTKGKKRWTFAARGPIVASPVMDDHALYVGSTDHFLYAVEPATGRLLWRFDTGAPVAATPAISQGVICIGGSGNIYGLDVRSGSLKWTQHVGGFFQSRAVASQGLFYLGGWDNTLFALDVLTGKPRWKTILGKGLADSPAVSSPTVGNGRIYISTVGGTLHALDATTGREKWAVRAPEGADPFGYSTAATVGLSLYVAGIGPHGDVYSLDTVSGKVDWRVATGQAIYDSSPKLSPDGRSLAIMGVRGHVAVLNTEAGKPLWSYELGPGNIFSTPAYDGKRVYSVTMANDVQAIDGPVTP